MAGVVFLQAAGGVTTGSERRCCRRLLLPKAMWGGDGHRQSATYLIGEDDGGLEVMPD
jgi:hypothetical protein